ncbi:MAG: hypothetical protein FJ104_09625, partial [Deltaproteobacteria bacterium]|nr:hypothetical protein [Deltaproteobacteria bacterium]
SLCTAPTAPTCAAAGNWCNDNAQCCAGLDCSALTNLCTAPTAPTCAASGSPCGANADCCAGLQCNAVAGGSVCGAPPAGPTCGNAGAGCSATEPCCAGLSCNAAAGGSVCGAPPTGGSCTAAGNWCNDNAQCCAGLDCSALTNLCTAPTAPTCTAAGNWCNDNAQCCAGLDCSALTNLCTAPPAGPTCGNAGAGCGAAFPCCAGLECNAATSSCAAPVLSNCANGVQDGNEWGVDCGPTCLGSCQMCGGTTSFVPNGNFEDVGGSSTQGQALLPAGWSAVLSSADTFSSDGSYGIAPGGFNHFPNVSAYDGVRWVAGAGGLESFGRALTAPLQPGARYRAEAAIHRDTGASGFARPGPGTYEVRLKSSLLGPTSLLAGTFTSATGNDWLWSTFEFVVPATAGTLSFVELFPTADSSGSYPGIDAFVLVQVSNCP